MTFCARLCLFVWILSSGLTCEKWGFAEGVTDLM